MIAIGGQRRHRPAPEFFERRSCDVLSTEGAPSNVAEMMRHWLHRQLSVLDLDHSADLRGLGMFDIVFCYGTLYHLRDPDGALARLAAVCGGMILLETVVSRGAHAELNPILQPSIANQAVSGIGCRPTRPWVMSALCRHFGLAYTTLDQPKYPGFVTDWSLIGHNGNLRAVFVGARQPLSWPTLTEALAIRHRNAPGTCGTRWGPACGSMSGRIAESTVVLPCKMILALPCMRSSHCLPCMANSPTARQTIMSTPWP